MMIAIGKAFNRDHRVRCNIGGAAVCKALIASVVLALGVVSLIQEGTNTMVALPGGLRPASAMPTVETVALRKSVTVIRHVAVRHRGVSVSVRARHVAVRHRGVTRTRHVAAGHRGIAVKTRHVALRHRGVAARRTHIAVGRRGAVAGKVAAVHKLRNAGQVFATNRETRIFAAKYA